MTLRIAATINRNWIITGELIVIANFGSNASFWKTAFSCSHFNYICWFCHGNHYQAMLIEKKQERYQGPLRSALKRNRIRRCWANIAHLLFTINKNDKYLATISLKYYASTPAFDAQVEFPFIFHLTKDLDDFIFALILIHSTRLNWWLLNSVKMNIRRSGWSGRCPWCYSNSGIKATENRCNNQFASPQ